MTNYCKLGGSKIFVAEFPPLRSVGICNAVPRYNAEIASFKAKLQFPVLRTLA